MTAPSPIKNFGFNNVSLTGLQKQFGMPKQVKEYSRFFPDKIANTGKDPKGGYFDFIRNDIMKPLNRNLEELPNSIKPYQKYEMMKLNKFENNLDNEKWALKTNKKCTSPEMIPKIQQYREYNFPKLTKDPVKVEKYKNTYLKSDNISIRYPNLEKNSNPEINKSIGELASNIISGSYNNAKDLNNNFYDIKNSDLNNINRNPFLSPNPNYNRDEKLGLVKNFKGKFNSNTETINYGWEPKGGYKSVSNRSSVVYNILSHSMNKVSGCLDTGVMDKKLLNKKKLITETLDLNQVFHNKVEKNYMNIVNENQNFFKKYTGIYTNICDAANKNGNIIPPFRSSDKGRESSAKRLKTHSRSRSSGSNILINNSIIKSSHNSPLLK